MGLRLLKSKSGGAHRLSVVTMMVQVDGGEDYANDKPYLCSSSSTCKPSKDKQVSQWFAFHPPIRQPVYFPSHDHEHCQDEGASPLGRAVVKLIFPFRPGLTALRSLS